MRYGPAEEKFRTGERSDCRGQDQPPARNSIPMGREENEEHHRFTARMHAGLPPVPVLEIAEIAEIAGIAGIARNRIENFYAGRVFLPAKCTGAIWAIVSTSDHGDHARLRRSRRSFRAFLPDPCVSSLQRRADCEQSCGS